MAIYTVRLLTSWNTTNGNNMQCVLDHPAPGVAYTDVTGQPDANIPTSPNALVVEAYPVDDVLLADFDADPNLDVLLVDEVLPNG